MFISKLVKISAVCSYVLACGSIAQVDQYPVYQAQAGAVPQQAQPGFPQSQSSFGDNQNQQGFNNPQYQMQQQGQQQQQFGPDGRPLMNAGGEKGKAPNPYLQANASKKVFSAKVYYQNGKKLDTQHISQDDLKQAIVVFFGDWCPHCDNFLNVLAKSLDFLRLYKINIIFINVPSPDVLQSGRELTIDDYNLGENKVSSHGIKLSSKRVFTYMLGDKNTLTNNGIESLPVVVALKDGQEYYRAVGEKAVTELDLSNPDNLKNFLGIWDEDVKQSEAKDSEDNSDTDSEEKGLEENYSSSNGKSKISRSDDFNEKSYAGSEKPSKKTKAKANKKKNKASKKASKKKVKTSKSRSLESYENVDIRTAKKATVLLNDSY